MAYLDRKLSGLDLIQFTKTVFPSTVYHSLGARRVAFALDFDPCGGVLDLAEVIGSKTDIGRSQVFLEPVALRCARDGNGPRLLGEIQASAICAGVAPFSPASCSKR